MRPPRRYQLLFGNDSFFPSPWVAVLVEERDKLHGFSGHTEVKPSTETCEAELFECCS